VKGRERQKWEKFNTCNYKWQWNWCKQHENCHFWVFYMGIKDQKGCLVKLSTMQVNTMYLLQVTIVFTTQSAVAIFYICLYSLSFYAYKELSTLLSLLHFYACQKSKKRQYWTHLPIHHHITVSRLSVLDKQPNHCQNPGFVFLTSSTNCHFSDTGWQLATTPPYLYTWISPVQKELNISSSLKIFFAGLWSTTQITAE
jgi:hypothetical protein